MTDRVVYVLPYIEVDREWKVGNLVLRKFDSSGSYTRWIYTAFCDREGRLIRKPTVICPNTTSRSSNLNFTSEVDQLLQVVQCSILDQSVVGKTRRLALLKHSEREAQIRRLLFGSPFVDASSMLSVETFIFEYFWESDEQSHYYEAYPSGRRREYAPPHVYSCRLMTSALAADPLCSTLLHSVNEPQFQPVLVAIRWFNLSKSRNPLFSSSQKLLFRCIAFESLLSLPREGKAAMFSYAVQVLIPTVSPERLEQWARSFYEKRSEVAHTGREVSPMIKSRNKRFEIEYGSELMLSEIVFNMCLKARLCALGLFSYPPNEKDILTFKLDSRLLSNKERIQAIRNVKFDQLISDKKVADKFVRSVDTVNFDYSGLDDDSIKAAMRKVKDLSLEFINHLQTTGNFNDAEKQTMVAARDIMSAINLSLPFEDEDSFLELPGRSRYVYDLSAKGRSDYDYYERSLEDQDLRVHLRKVVSEKKLDEIRNTYKRTSIHDTFYEFLPFPYISLEDLYTALHALWGLQLYRTRQASRPS